MPKAVWLSRKTDKAIFAAAVLVGVVRDASGYALAFTRCVPLESPSFVDATAVKFFGSVFELKAARECQLRRTSARTGGTMVEHFVEHERGTWRVLSLDLVGMRNMNSAMSDPSLEVTVAVPYDFVIKLGIAADVRDAHVRNATQAPDTDLLDASDDDTAAPAPPAALPAPQALPMELTFSLGDISVAHARGTVRHTYTTAALLECLKLSRDLRPGASLHDVLASSARLLLGKSGEQVVETIRSKEYALPSVDVLREAKIRLDVFRILFQQKLFLVGKHRHYGVFDASPQLGYNILAVIEEAFHTRTAHADHTQALGNLFQRPLLEVGASFVNRCAWQGWADQKVDELQQRSLDALRLRGALRRTTEKFQRLHY